MVKEREGQVDGVLVIYLDSDKLSWIANAKG